MPLDYTNIRSENERRYGTDIGRILAPGLDPVQLANALTLTFNYTGSRNTGGGVAGLIVPEPAVLSLMGLGVMGFMARQRKQRRWCSLAMKE